MTNFWDSITIARATLPHRLARAPMTRSSAKADDIPGDFAAGLPFAARPHGTANHRRHRPEIVTTACITSMPCSNPTSATTSRLIAEFSDLTRMLMSLFAPYRPELHYMRGPGPKWHAKNDGRISGD
jgi:hypothetical protein